MEMVGLVELEAVIDGVVQVQVAESRDRTVRPIPTADHGFCQESLNIYYDLFLTRLKKCLLDLTQMPLTI